MKQYLSIILVAILANYFTIVLYKDVASQPGGSGASVVFMFIWMPLVWITSLLLSIFLSIKNRKKYFVKGKTIWSIIILLCCTPIPLYYINKGLHPSPETIATETLLDFKNGRAYKTEHWKYSSDYQKKYVDKYFVADSLDLIQNGDSAFKKDSIWIFFSIEGDTISIEKYLTR